MNQSIQDDNPIVPGSRPLKIASQERYAHARAMFYKPADAARIAGFSSRSGQSCKWEKKRKVQDRIAYLGREAEELTRAKRAEIENLYWLAMRVNASAFWKNGFARPAEDIEPEYHQLIEGYTLTKEGLNLKIVSKLAATQELRKMLGLDAPTKVAPTNQEGTGPYVAAVQWLRPVDDSESAA